MTTTATTTDETLSPKAAGILTRAVRALMKTDPKAAAELVQDASVAALSKADELLRSQADRNTVVIDDQWDGPPDATVNVVHTGGPGSTAPSGSIPVGPGESMSGAGAPAMQATYSRPASQNSAQYAFEQLGRDVMRMGKAQRAAHNVLEAHGLQFATMKAALDDLPSAASISEIVTEAISKALPVAIAAAVAEAVKAIPVQDATVVKADDKKDDDDKDKNPFAKADDPEVAAKAASMVTEARAELAKASEAEIDGALKKALRLRQGVLALIEEAEPLMAKALPDTRTAYENICKAVTTAQSQNQDIWPNTDVREAAKATPAQTDTETRAELTKAAESIAKAAEGLGMLSASVQQVLGAVGNASRNGTGLPPVFSLAKAQSSDVDARMVQVRALAEAGEITWGDVDATNDAVQRLRMSATGAGMPPAWAQQGISGLHPKVQQILGNAA